MLRKILAIAGRPGLFEIISQGKNMIVVEDVITKKRIPAHQRDKLMSLGDIAMYTDDGDIPLGEILDKVYANRNGEKINIKELTASKGLRSLFEEIVPDYDKDRVYESDIKKLFQWYNILVEAGFKEFAMKEEEETEEGADEEKAAE